MTAIIEITASPRTFTQHAESRPMTLTAKPREGIVDWWQFEDYSIIDYESDIPIDMETTGTARIAERREFTLTGMQRTFTLHSEDTEDTE